MEHGRSYYYRQIRPDVIESLQCYAKSGVRTADFLDALLRNDLRTACQLADRENRETLWCIVHYCENELPRSCWGSPMRVNAHLAKHRDIGTTTLSARQRRNGRAALLHPRPVQLRMNP